MRKGLKTPQKFCSSVLWDIKKKCVVISITTSAFIVIITKTAINWIFINVKSHSQHEIQQTPRSGGGGGKLPGGVSRMVFPFLLLFFGFNSFLLGLNPGCSSVAAARIGPSSPGCSVKGKNSSPGYGKE